MLENIISSIQISFLARRSRLSQRCFTQRDPPPSVRLGLFAGQRDTPRDVYNVFENRFVPTLNYAPRRFDCEFMEETSEWTARATLEISFLSFFLSFRWNRVEWTVREEFNCKTSRRQAKIHVIKLVTCDLEPSKKLSADVQRIAFHWETLQIVGARSL